MKYKLATSLQGCCAMSSRGCRGCCSKKQSSYDWLSDIPEALQSTHMVEVQFKNTRKNYYANEQGLELEKGDMVVVEAPSGYDIGEVTLVGKMVDLAIKKHRWHPEKGVTYKVRRLADAQDLERKEIVQGSEETTMIRARQLASDLGLEMKIGDVEYQADGSRAIFYYIADGRVDFRQLIRVLADHFHVRIEMKQIGARQEAGRIGGIGPCGRELCCASWMTSFISVNTHAARIQDVSLNPQKLTGMCGKLKCCMNHEANTYAEAHRTLPSREVVLETKQGNYYHFKTDIFQRLMTYSRSARFPEGLVTVPADRVFAVIELNQRGELPDVLLIEDEESKTKEKKNLDILEDNSLTRFDKKLKGGRGRKAGGGGSTPRSKRVKDGGEVQASNRQNLRQNRPPRSERRAVPRSAREDRGPREG